MSSLLNLEVGGVALDVQSVKSRGERGDLTYLGFLSSLLSLGVGEVTVHI